MTKDQLLLLVIKACEQQLSQPPDKECVATLILIKASVEGLPRTSFPTDIVDSLQRHVDRWAKNEQTHYRIVPQPRRESRVAHVERLEGPAGKVTVAIEWARLVPVEPPVENATAVPATAGRAD